jgi:hypothetical protein
VYVFYGKLIGVRIARIHIAWYLQQRSDSVGLGQRINRVETAAARERHIVDDHFDTRELVA